MKKEATIFRVVLTTLLMGMVQNVSAQFGGGDGSKENPYIILTAEHLNNVRTSLDSYFIIQNDIDLVNYQEDKGWLPIAGFSGHLNGQGHTIKNLKINRPEENYQGLFAQMVPPESRVENLTVSGNIIGNAHVGGIVGHCMGVISNCSFSGTVEGKNPHTGGIAGMVMTQGPNRAIIINCYNTASVKGSSQIGGITGFCSNATITNSFNTGNVSQATDRAGGIAGFNDNGEIKNCYNTGNLSGEENIGGIVGFSAPHTSTVTKCYNSGSIRATNNGGGIIGKNAESPISYCVAVNTTIEGESGLNRIAGISLGSTDCYTNNYALADMLVAGKTVTESDAASLNGLSKSLHELRLQSTYETGLSWNFTDDWVYVIGYYPQIKSILPVPEPLFESGTGMETEPYALATPRQLDNIRQSPYSYFILLNDIDLIDYQEGEGWIPIPVFGGYLNGNGHTIKNLKINRPTKEQQGLIASGGNNPSGKTPEIKDLSVSGNIIAKGAGGIVYSNSDLNIKRCSFSGSIEANANVGGIVAYMTTSTTTPEAERLYLTECHNHAEIHSKGTAGGLVGTGSYIIVSNCYNEGNITAEYGYIGGIIGSATGWNRGEGPNAETGGCLITDCYNTGEINGGYKIGGIAGSALVHKTNITKSYNTGNIRTENEEGITGGIAGFCTDANVTLCVAANSELTGKTVHRIVGDKSGKANIEKNLALETISINGSPATENGSDSLNGLNKTMKELKSQSPYETELGWDFETTWISVPGYFPVLKNVSEIPQEMFAGGEGTQEDPYVITTALHLYNVRNHLDAYYIMEADIDLADYQSGEGWTPIGLPSTTGFIGNFNGKGHTIANLKINRPQTNGQSLFGYVKNAAIDSITITEGSVIGNEKTAMLVSHGINVTLKGNKISGNLEGKAYVAGIIGFSEQSSVENCMNEANITALAKAGGIAGYSDKRIINCFNRGKISLSSSPDTGYYNAGGIVAINEGGTIENSRNEGELKTESKNIGGIAGINDKGSIKICYNGGYITGYEKLGGITGMNNQGEIIEAHNGGIIEGTVDLGGIAGRNWQATMTDCHNTGEIKGAVIDPGTTGAVGGVVGVNDQSITTLCHNEGNVCGFDFVGGVAGVNTGTLLKSYNTGNIKGNDQCTGGVTGTNHGDSESTFLDLCYNEGNVEGVTYTGGIAGKNSGKLTNSYNKGIVKGNNCNGGIAGFNKTLSGGAVIISFCLNLGNIIGNESYHGGIIGNNSYSGQITFNVAANEQIDGDEAYRIIGREETNTSNYTDNNHAFENMLINGTKVNSDDPMSFDGKGISQNKLWEEDIYLALGWDFDDNWYIAEGISYPVLAWQPKLTTDISGKIYVDVNQTYKFKLELSNAEAGTNPINNIEWSYEEGNNITISSSDHLEYAITGTQIGATTLLKISLKGGNTLYIPIEIKDGSKITDSIYDEIQVYPNPVVSSGTLTINTGETENSIKRIDLYDISSRLIRTVEVKKEKSISIPMENIAEGNYLLHIITDSGENISRHILVK